MTIDDLYKDLLIAQLDKNWGKVARIQRDLYRHPDYRREEGESSLEPNPANLRNNEGTV